MRKNWFSIIILVLLCGKAFAQDQIVAKGDTLVLPGGSKYWLGEQVTLGTGSLGDKSFNFIYMPMPQVLHLVKNKSAEPTYAGQVATVKKFQRDGAYKNSYSYNILVLEFADRRRFWCDIQAAINANEIIDNNAKNAGPESKEARLARLQKLYDSGQITKDEYDTLKAKILADKDPNPNTKKTSDSPAVF